MASSTSANQNIKMGPIRNHNKASERYIEVEFSWGKTIRMWDVPIEYRRTGVDFGDKSMEEVATYIKKVYDTCAPEKWKGFKADQEEFWAMKPNSSVTKPFFDILNKDYKWVSVPSQLPSNPNWARRIQDLKEFGYTIATNTSMQDKKTGKKCTHLLLLPIPRSVGTGYETWSPKMRTRIIKALNAIDSYEFRLVNKDSLLPDHKFPEIRWDTESKRDSLEELTDEEIKANFQLLNNQRNLQKREVCRSCFQTGERGTPFGIDFFYQGKRTWDVTIPKRGPEAEKGCVGCGWYDLQKWRDSLNKNIGSPSEK